MCTDDVLVNKQYGLRIKISTESAPFIVFNEILMDMNNRHSLGKIKKKHSVASRRPLIVVTMEL
jgi:hypothetical protein